jgi:hypothetical protein
LFLKSDVSTMKILLKKWCFSNGKNGENVAEEWCFSNGKKMLLKSGVSAMIKWGQGMEREEK